MAAVGNFTITKLKILIYLCRIQGKQTKGVTTAKKSSTAPSKARVSSNMEDISARRERLAAAAEARAKALQAASVSQKLW